MVVKLLAASPFLPEERGVFKCDLGLWDESTGVQCLNYKVTERGIKTICQLRDVVCNRRTPAGAAALVCVPMPWNSKFIAGCSP